MADRRGSSHRLILTDRAARALIDGEETGEAPLPVELVATPAVPAARPGTKAQTVLTLLARAKGASLAALIDASGWLPHTVRAALTGLRRKGHVIERGHAATGPSGAL